jgi:hypothetical protein
MRKSLLLIIFQLLIAGAFAQVRVSKLVIKPKEVYTMGQSDIIVADTLVMMDDSKIVLNSLKKENYIRVKVAIFGNNTTIEGAGVDGKPGLSGKPYNVPTGPCQNGQQGRNGMRGLDGGSGINLFLYIDKITANGRLVISLGGGNGGNGGDGGEGGGGSPGTLHCRGGNGGTGGNGGNGGNGGEGGTLTIGGNDVPAIKAMISNYIVLLNKGGNFGYAGISGPGGSAGLGPSKRNGRDGSRGIDGVNGRSGTNGTIRFEEI